MDIDSFHRDIKAPVTPEEYISQSISNGGFLILNESDLKQDFFDLSAGQAGELMQKCVNYKQCLAIIVPDPKLYSSSFQELVEEHKNHPYIRFVTSEIEARAFVYQE